MVPSASLCRSVDTLLPRDVTDEDACAAAAALWLSPSLSRLDGSACVAPNASRSCISFPGFEEEIPPLFAVDEGALCDRAAVAVLELARLPLLTLAVEPWVDLAAFEPPTALMLRGIRPFISPVAFFSLLALCFVSGEGLLFSDFVLFGSDFGLLFSDLAALLASADVFPFSNFVSASCFRNFAISWSLSSEGRVEACSACFLVSVAEENCFFARFSSCWGMLLALRSR